MEFAISIECDHIDVVDAGVFFNEKLFLADHTLYGKRNG